MISHSISRNISYRLVNTRALHSTNPVQSFLGNWFNRKKSSDEPAAPKREKKDIIKDQDNYEVDPNAKIVVLNKSNSPKYEKFKISTHMPDFKINQWKVKSIKPKEIESTYTSNDLIQIINQVHLQLNKEGSGEVTMDTLKDNKLTDLSYRFKFTKELQRLLGFDISDYILTKAHDLDILFKEVDGVIKSRTKNERNPNDIALRPEDFTAPNIYFNEELSEFEQSRKFKDLVEKARGSL